MILSIIKFFQGYVRVQLTGYDIERFLNLCGQKNILIWNIASTKNECFCNISLPGFWKIKPICHKTHTKLKILRRNGVPFVMKRYKKRWIFFLCFLLALASLKVASNHVWKIQVQGNASISDDEIILFLENHHCGYGDSIQTLELEELEGLLRNAYSEIIWTSVDLKGTCITVSIKENLLLSDEKDYAFDQDKGYDLICERDGTVTSIVTRNGTPEVSVGAQVKKGQILISGNLPIYNDAKEVIAYLPVIADGDIFIDSDVTYEKKFPLKHVEKKYTNQSWNLYYPELRGAYPKFLLKLMNRNDCDQMIEKKQLCLWNNYYLPIYWCHLEQKQFEKETKSYKKEEAIQKGNSYFVDYCNKLQQKGIQTIEKNVMITCKDGYCKIQGQLTIRKQVGRYQETTLPELQDIDEGQLEQ